MLTRLGYYADKALETGWLAAAVVAPLYFNVYSSRVFEPDKIATVRTVVLLMVVAWIIKLAEGGWRAMQRSGAETRGGRLAAGASGVVETAAPGWLGFLRLPVVIAILVYALVYLVSTIFSVTPDASIFGSYQRGQGLYSQYSYMMLGIIVLANLRTRVQLDRLINVMLLTSLPVALYGIVQALKFDPLPWAGDTSTRVASTMGNAIFVAAWLIMVIPFAFYRLMTGVSGMMAARHAAEASEAEVEVASGSGRRPARRLRVEVGPSYGWAVVANSTGIIFAGLMLLYMSLKMMSGLPYPDARTWWVFPFILVLYGLGILAIEWMGRRADDLAQQTVVLPAVGVGLAIVALLALAVTWNLDNANNALRLQIGFDGGGLLAAVFFVLLWATISAAAYAFSAREREEGYSNPDRGVVRSFLNVGYGALIVIMLICIYLTQSRGPWLGLGAGLFTFVLAMWLVGRHHRVNWMLRIGRAFTLVAVAGLLFVGLLNIPGQPLGALSSLPVVGRGIERLSTLTRTEDGTGKVRTLIWKGATDLIVSDPARAIIGWGPEAMYVAYNRFYPPELAQVELRNATPDRSHNVEFDHMVTMGVLGLLAYYLVVGTFFFFGIRLVKRATNTRDQLLAITFIAAVASHFVEIQTGIQIASTWTYFYLTIGMMAAFGWYITGYLRRDAVPVDVEAGEAGTATGTAFADVEAEEQVAEARPVAAVAGAGAGATGRRSGTVTAQTGGNGRAPVQPSSKPASRTGGKASTPVAPQGGRAAQGGSATGDGSRRRGAGSVQHGPSRGIQAAKAGPQWVSNPTMLILYAVLGLGAVWFALTVNSGTVAADTLFKQAQAYDSYQRYFRQTDQVGNVFPGSIPYYEEAISLQPNQDYYYLFLGRAWLEAAKRVDNETYNERLQANWTTAGAGSGSTTEDQRKLQEKLYRLQQSEIRLKQANSMSPLNTDHYANLGRLYLYWSDPSGGKDTSKAPLAVQYMKAATEHTPGNAQLWDELGVSYVRNNQFTEGMAALEHSQNEVDPTYARTPFIKGTLLRERAMNVRNAIAAGAATPTGGETDYGKLVVASAKAYSDTIALDPVQMDDTELSSRLSFFVDAGTPFTGTTSTIPASELSQVLTGTIMQSATNQMGVWEGALTKLAREKGVQFTGDTVPDDTLKSLWSNPAWSGTASGSIAWSDDSMQTISSKAAACHVILGQAYSALGRKADAQRELARALLLQPNDTEIQAAYDKVK